MAELIYKENIKNCYIADVRLDGKTPCSATYMSIRKMIDIQPTVTEEEIRAKAIDEFTEKLYEKTDLECNQYFDNDYSSNNREPMYLCSDINRIIQEVAEQMKAGVNNE